ncbi:hypothetical protein UPYG_G00007740 [Umbra pygmaea]|uniref:LEM domain-containing protein n=1 Tax=Umbra pygmaea TaxID=75934 RepID=A0ABD0XHV3_UMBPY
MPVFVEDPAQFSKPRLKSELIAHNVTLPAAESKKHVYLELYLKYIALKSAADFSSDEEDVQDSQDCEEEKKKNPEMINPCGLTDDELKATLLKYGFKAGPIVATTRPTYERKLQNLLEPTEHRQNGDTRDEDQYSEEDLEDSGSEQGILEENQVDDIQIGRHFRKNLNAEFCYHQCFMPSSRMRVQRDPGCFEYNPRRNAGNHGNAAEMSGTEERRPQIPLSPVTHEALQSRTSSVLGLATGSPVHPQSSPLGGGGDPDSTHSSRSFSITQMIEKNLVSSSRSAVKSGLNGSSPQGPSQRPHWQESAMEDKFTMTNSSLCITAKSPHWKRQIKEEPITDVLMEMFPETEPTPTGISATRRRPIKGAAGRPVSFKYPDLLASPMAQQRQAVEHRLVPLWVQILVFLGLCSLIYVLYAAMDNSLDNPFVSLLDNLSLETATETEGMLLHTEH